jgi:hypothetical protein
MRVTIETLFQTDINSRAKKVKQLLCDFNASAVVFVEDFGVVCNGVTDDAEALQWLLGNLKSETMLVFPETGKCYISRDIIASLGTCATQRDINAFGEQLSLYIVGPGKVWIMSEEFPDALVVLYYGGKLSDEMFRDLCGSQNLRAFVDEGFVHIILPLMTSSDVGGSMKPESFLALTDVSKRLVEGLSNSRKVSAFGRLGRYGIAAVTRFMDTLSVEELPELLVSESAFIREAACKRLKATN